MSDISIDHIWGRDAHKNSMVECQVHGHLKIGGEYFIGGTKGTIESFLEDGGSRGQTDIYVFNPHIR
jgi:hypothetical protein